VTWIEVQYFTKTYCSSKNWKHLGERIRHYAFFAIGNNQQLHLARGETDEIKLEKSIHIAFAVTDFDRYLSFLNDIGVAYSNFEGDSNQYQTRPDGVKQIYLQDPDGYWIEINDAKH